MEAGDGAFREIYLDVGEARDAELGRGLGAAEEDAEAGEEFAAAERLGQVVIGAGVEGGDFLRFAVAHGENEHGKLAPLAEAAEDLEAGHVGEAEIEDDGVGAEDGGFVEAEGAGGGFAHTVTGGFEGEAKEAADLNLVVDDEDVGFGGYGSDGRHGLRIEFIYLELRKSGTETEMGMWKAGKRG